MTHPCPCGRVHAATEVVAVGRFRRGGPIGWRANGHPVIRQTRAGAMRDVCPDWELGCSDDECVTEEHGR